MWRPGEGAGHQEARVQPNPQGLGQDVMGSAEDPTHQPLSPGPLIGGKNSVCKMKGVPDAVSWEVGRRPSGNCPCSARWTPGCPPPSL